MRRVLEALGSGVVVYVVVAACAEAMSGGDRAETDAGSRTASPVDPNRGAGDAAAADPGSPQPEPSPLVPSPVPDALAQVESGSRLKLIWLEAAGGFRYPSDVFWDSEFEFECRAAGDFDSLRCLPMQGASELFTNSSCTRAIYLPQIQTPDASQYYSVLSRGSEYVSVRKTGPATATATLYSAASGECLEFLGGLEGDFFAGDVVPLSEFERITRATD